MLLRLWRLIRPALPRLQPVQRLLLVTGLLGAGKTTALKVLEDLGWEIIDNFPIRLLERLIEAPESDTLPAPLAIGFDCRTRGFDPEGIIRESQDPWRSGADLELTTLFLDCTQCPELERRFNETRRRHPLATDLSGSRGDSRGTRASWPPKALGRRRS